jgi:hypothetical protein
MPPPRVRPGELISLINSMLPRVAAAFAPGKFLP